MANTKLETEQLLAGALLLNFDKVTNVDMTILSEDFLKKNHGYDLIPTSSSYLNKYIKDENGVISLKDGLNFDTFIPENNSDLKTRLKQIAGKCVREYIEKFDMEEFLLRKISYYSQIPTDFLDKIFNKNQLVLIDDLDQNGYLDYFGEEEYFYDDTQVITLSDYGRLKLFKIDHAKEIDRFIEELKQKNYDDSLLDDFLLSQNLEQSVWKILNINTFEKYCEIYKRCHREDGEKNVYYEQIAARRKIIGFDKQSKKLIKKMFSFWNNTHSLYVCRPNDIFVDLSDDTEINTINWNAIDIDKMLNSSIYELLPGYHGYDYVHLDLTNQLMMELNNGNDDPVSYLVIIERCPFNYTDYYIVRGIIRADLQGMSFAFNPEYQRAWDNNITIHTKKKVFSFKRKK